MTLDDFNTIAWRDFILWAWNEPEMREQFTAKTGIEIQSVTAPINAVVDAVIDAASGTRKSVVAQFVEWATREHWGVEHAPATYQKELAKKGTRS